MGRFATPEDEWRSYLDGTHPMVRLGRRTFARIPSDPRCRVCYAPFGQPGGAVFRRLGFQRWDKSPNICTHCVNELADHEVIGVEAPVTFLFADIRRSSEMARGMSTLELRLSNVLKSNLRLAAEWESYRSGGEFSLGNVRTENPALVNFDVLMVSLKAGHCSPCWLRNPGSSSTLKSSSPTMTSMPAS